MTPIRETIARAIFDARWPGHWNDHEFLLQQDQVYDETDAVLRALDEAGCVVVRKDEFFASRGREPCAMELEWARQRAQDLKLP